MSFLYIKTINPNNAVTMRSGVWVGRGRESLRGIQTTAHTTSHLTLHTRALRGQNESKSEKSAFLMFYCFITLERSREMRSEKVLIKMTFLVCKFMNGKDY